jgi:hypothetical protein
MARFAADLGQPDVEKWRALAEEFAARTARLWRGEEGGLRTEDGGLRPKTTDGGAQRLSEKTPNHQDTKAPSIKTEGSSRTSEQNTSSSSSLGDLVATSHLLPRYADFDTRAGRLTEVDDIMLLAPLALGVTRDGRASALRPAIAAIDPAQIEWPMGIWTAVAAAEQAGMQDVAAELAWAIVDRAYRFWDARQHRPDRTLPGVACEYWPVSGRCGGEGYGWGAFGVHLVLHTLLGFTPAKDGLRLRPNLPAAWRVAGRRYAAQLHWRDRELLVELAPLGPERARVTIGDHAAEIAWGAEIVYSWDDGAAMEIT